MKRFIPAWYRSDPWWRSQALPFFYKEAVTEFDDLISLMGMHLKNQVPFEIVVLNHAPDLRTFLHRQALYEADYWSLFDMIQGFTHQPPQPLDYRQLNWPKGTEFVQSLLLVKAFTGPDTYSEIHFSQEGYLLWIESFQHEVQQYRYIFDDRGFLSSYQTFDEAGGLAEQYYMTATGDWIMKEDLKTGEVHIHSSYAHRFEQQCYATMTELIDAYLARYTSSVQDTDITVVASDMRHNALITRHFSPRQLCFSVFQQRKTGLSEAGMASIERGHYWLADTMENAARLERHQTAHQLDNALVRITPFDVRMNPNISSQLYETYIGVWTDGIDEVTLNHVVDQLIKEIERDPQTRVTFLSRLENHKRPIWVNGAVKRLNAYFDSRTKEEEKMQETAPKGSTDPVVYATLKSVPFENDVVEAISTLRVVIDLNEEPDLFLQICCMGAGLPQINRMQTDYVQHERNGYMIANIDELAAGLSYFLGYLKHWNRSYAYAMKLAKAYASNEILKQLDDWLEGETDGATI